MSLEPVLNAISGRPHGGSPWEGFSSRTAFLSSLRWAGLLRLLCIVAFLFGGFTSTALPRDYERKAIVQNVWTSTRMATSQENAEQHWRKHRREFPELRTLADYIAAARDFVTRPPPGTLFKERPNGDRLFYHPPTNTFAVQARSGAIRTLFRPNNGLNYWNRQ